MRAFDSDKLVIATHNKGKLREIAELLAPFGIEVVSAGDLGFEEPEETEDTFAGNARIKAHFAAKASGLPALSDDSGIMIDALDGAPGVYTADWAETPNGRDFPMAMKKVWDLLEEKNAPEPRTARFCATLCLAWPDGHDEIFEGTIEGRIVWPMRGEHGFGFDPIFLPDGETETFGEMDPERKQAISHRTDAFRQLVSGPFKDLAK
ncbi:RdgB/HAM1 family non-canonical purine NTP pyrophosphatase [Celeribacter halophilus]|jgi:XTP/dITP diphosphohydrolase|uniref:RdgB/HAM1 family non-canonical purine NTP pyrophosphatase n=1 Tax=Celeribacter halophilus TaxID=576117 RepID=UPI001C0880E2|nr:RdgB/HAM1 family non-canonical purine NTP pyrophosphatase [Celeribacter halophilus]MBU2889680.1 RdgB/HAM1 family non-canonical purine NTP pyrophosphatase [Celeribacter halophilus]MDO6510677.1 RdgB/HAM1 family non-canonical purine NTP pyrophosphatase [Celeribacter halophilus]